MTFYSYTAKDKEGNLYQGVHEVKERTDLYALIRQEGGTPVKIKEKKKNALIENPLGGAFPKN